ncbi:MAG: glycoside hydrolase family 43 protein [Candidatus Lokiarchaeota archaeon]|nr:glycoside hydrolase family 43 protein [Candidatus Lokiarchaeota archaeon]
MFIDWASLRNPLYSHLGWSVKDACMEWKDGVFYIFTSAFYRDRGRERSHVVGITTSDWKHFSKPFLHVDGRDGGWTGMCSPNITRVDDAWYLTFNSWGNDHPNGNRNQLFCMKSADLKAWTPPVQVGENLTREIRCIDIAITHTNGKFYVMWKDESVFKPRKQYKTRIATCTSLEGPWAFIGDGYPRFFLRGGGESPLVHENYQFIKIDGKQRLLSLDYSPHHPVLYEIGGDPARDESWSTWVDGHDLAIQRERFNTVHVANAPFIADWRRHDGHFYMLYAGRTHGLTHAGRGNNKLALSRSPDLVTWYPPPNT